MADPNDIANKLPWPISVAVKAMKGSKKRVEEGTSLEPPPPPIDRSGARARAYKNDTPGGFDEYQKSLQPKKE